VKSIKLAWWLSLKKNTMVVVASRLDYAVEATGHIRSATQFHFVSGFGFFVSGLNEQIILFDGTIGESCGLERSLVALVVARGGQKNQ
jgi:hypothetical protein